MTTDTPTQFDYLLNAMEIAGQADKPAEHRYGDKRRALFTHVRTLERDLSECRAALAELVAVDNLWCTAKAAGTHERERSNLFAEYASRKPLAIATARALATKEPQS